MKTMLKTSIALALLLVVGLTIWIGYTQFRGAGFKFIERKTGVELPPGTMEKATRDPYFHFVMGCARLHKSEIDAFVTRYGFAPGGVHPTNMTSYEFGEVNRRYASIPSDGDLVHLSGEIEGLPWMFTLDRATGKLWCVVTYPD